jgi:hypothetical protein
MMAAPATGAAIPVRQFGCTDGTKFESCCELPAFHASRVHRTAGLLQVAGGERSLRVIQDDTKTTTKYDGMVGREQHHFPATEELRP